MSCTRAEPGSSSRYTVVLYTAPSLVAAAAVSGNNTFLGWNIIIYAQFFISKKFVDRVIFTRSSLRNKITRRAAAATTTTTTSTTMKKKGKTPRKSSCAQA
uniref:Secreted protein n=1 Tax=Trichogramma kaykai TaxID=54128 RepID=A0ABD2VV96_9HYME